MKTYKQIRTELERLQREADAARKAEAAGVIAKMKKTIEEYGLTAADLGLDAAAGGAAAQPSAKAVSKSASRKAASKKAPAKKATGAGVAKYHDPESGKSWSGFGRMPGWLAEKKDPEAFRVGAGAPPAEPQAAPAPAAPEPEAAARPASKKAAKKAGAKAAGKKAAGKKAPARKAAAKKAATAEAPAADNGATPEPAADQPAPAAGDEAAPPA